MGVGVMTVLPVSVQRGCLRLKIVVSTLVMSFVRESVDRSGSSSSNLPHTRLDLSKNIERSV